MSRTMTIREARGTMKLSDADSCRIAVPSLAGRGAIATGSTSGIGLGIARALAAEGAAVMLNGLGDPVAIEATRQVLENESGAPVLYSAADMSKPDAIARMVDEAGARFGQVDILINNAGIQHVAPLENFPPEKWDAILAINLSAAFHAARATFAGMKARK